MVKRFIFGALTLMFVLCMVGCGGDKKTESSTPKASADKAILAYAELAALGMSDNSAATGLPQKDIDAIVDNWDNAVYGLFGDSFPLSDESMDEVNATFYAHLATEMEIKTRLKKDDPKNPVVELTACVLDKDLIRDYTSNSDAVKGIFLGIQELKDAGFDEEAMKNNAKLQENLVKLLGEYIDDFPVVEEQSIDIVCEQIKGDDGKMYWAPKNTDDVVNFVLGK